MKNCRRMILAALDGFAGIAAMKTPNHNRGSKMEHEKPEFGAPYQGAREDLLMWKREAESLREQLDATHGAFILSVRRCKELEKTILDLTGTIGEQKYTIGAQEGTIKRLMDTLRFVPLTPPNAGSGGQNT